MHLIARKIPIAQPDNKAIGKRDIRNCELLTECPEPAILEPRKMLRGSRAYDSPTNHDFPDSYSATIGAKFIMTDKPPTATGRSHLFTGKDSRSISALKLRAEQLGLTHYASLYGDRRCSRTWQKLLENAPELEPLHPRPQLSQFKKSDYQPPHRRHYAIVLSVAAIVSFILLQPLRSKVLPVYIDVKIQFTGQK